LAAAGVARTCGSSGAKVSKEEAIEIAKESASFKPCDETGCVVVRGLRRGFPSRLYWLVGLAEGVNAGGEPTRSQSFLIDARTGDLSAP
jgi:hypothetical protein